MRLTSSAQNGATGDIALTSTGANPIYIPTMEATVKTSPSVNAGNDQSVFEQNPINLDASVTTFNSGFSGTADIFTEDQSETANYSTSQSSLADPNWTTTDEWKGESDATLS